MTCTGFEPVNGALKGLCVDRFTNRPIFSAPNVFRRADMIPHYLTFAYKKIKNPVWADTGSERKTEQVEWQEIHKHG